MRAIKRFISIEEAQRILLSGIKYNPRTSTKQPRKAIGRVVAEDVYSPIDRPPMHVSHMDGFAVKSSETSNATPSNPVRLRVTSFIGPSVRGPPLKEGTAARIHTGGYLPEGADSVIPQEEVKTQEDYIIVSRYCKPLENVDQRGSDVRAGQLIVRRGEVLTPVKAALLESLGIYELSVFEGARISVICFGDELTDEIDEVHRGKILNTFSPMILSMLKFLGCEAVYGGICPDEPEEARRRILDALAISDGIVTIGGSSVGDVDVVSSCLSEDADVFVQGLKLQPGRVGGFALIRGKPIIMLPGLIHSTINVFNYLVAPALAMMHGVEIESLITFKGATLSRELSFNKWIDFLKIVWVKTSRSDEAIMAEPLLGESSRISTIAFAEGYIEVPPNVDKLKGGTPVKIIVPSWIRGHP